MVILLQLYPHHDPHPHIILKQIIDLTSRQVYSLHQSAMTAIKSYHEVLNVIKELEFKCSCFVSFSSQFESGSKPGSHTAFG